MKNSQPLAFLLFLAVAVLGYLLPAVGYFSSVPGDLGDARFNSVILEHLYRWLGGQDSSLWSPPYFYPFEGALAFSENHFGSGITYIFFRWLGFEREAAYNGWFLIGALLNYLASYFVLRQLGFSCLASACGAFVFAFSLPALFHQDVHSQLLYRYAIPLAALGLFRVLETGRLFHLGQTFLWVAAEFFCSIYLGLFLVYLLAAMVLAAAFVKRGQHGLTKIIYSISAEPPINKVIFVFIAVLSSVAVGLLLHRYQMTSREYGFTRLPSEIANMLPRLGSYLIADRSGLSSWIGDRVTIIATRWEHQMFLGVGVLFIAAYGALAMSVSKHKDILGQIALISVGLLFIGTLYLGGQSIYLWLIKIPGLGAIRAVSRIVLVMLFPMSILVAVGVDRIRSASKFQGSKMRLFLTVGLAALLGAETASCRPYNEPITAWRDRISAVKALLPIRIVDRPIVYISRSHAEPFYAAELDGMILGQDIGIPTLNGYSGNAPPGYTFEADPCFPYQYALYAYATFRKLPKESAADLARRVVHLAPEACNREVVSGSDDVITSAQARSIRITVANVDYSGRRFTVTINNDSTEVLNPFSSKGQVRLAWRFVPLNAAGFALAEPEWTLRKNIWFVVRPGNAESEMIETDFPNQPGVYRLEVTLVQEGVAWFHDKGMLVGSEIFSGAQGYKTIGQQLYLAYRGRPADPTGLANLEVTLSAADAPTNIQDFRAAYRANAAVRETIDGFVASAEFQQLYAGDTAIFVTAVFRHLFNRAPRAAGLAYWIRAIEEEKLSKGNAVLLILTGALSNTTPQGLIDANTVKNKFAVAAKFTSAISTDDKVVRFKEQATVARARDLLATVSDRTDPNAFQEEIAAILAERPPASAATGALPPSKDPGAP